VLTLKQSLPISLLSAQNLLSEDDVEIKRVLISRLSTAYKLDYADKNSVHFEAAKDLFRLAVQENYTPDEFLQRLDQMLMTCKFYTWTPADFFQHERGTEKLYSYEWVMDEVKKNQKAMAAMEAYRIPGFQKPLYRYADGKKLEEQNPDWKVVFRCGKHFTENVVQAAPAKETTDAAIGFESVLKSYKQGFLNIHSEMYQAEQRTEMYKRENKNLQDENRRLRHENTLLRRKLEEIFSENADVVETILAAPRYEEFQEAA